MDGLEREIEATIYDFNLNNIPPKRTAKRIMALITQKAPVAEVPCSAGLVASLNDVERLIDCGTLVEACKCYSNQTNGSTAAHFALDKVRIRVQKIIDEISS